MNLNTNMLLKNLLYLTEKTANQKRRPTKHRQAKTCKTKKRQSTDKAPTKEPPQTSLKRGFAGLLILAPANFSPTRHTDKATDKAPTKHRQGTEKPTSLSATRLFFLLNIVCLVRVYCVCVNRVSIVCLLCVKCVSIMCL